MVEMNSAAPGGVTRPLVLGLADLLTVGDRTDQSGRLLLEDSASRPARRAALRAGVPMKSSKCPFHDTPSRVGGPMNLSAYEALRADTAGILDGFAWLTSQLLSTQGSSANSIQLLYDVSYLGITVPLLLFHRAVDPVPPYQSLPTVVASLFKASRGLFSVAVALLNENGPPSRAIDAAQVVAFADQHGHFVHPAPRRVCAAPTRLIERTISVILSGDGANGSASALGEMVAFPELWRFYRVQDDLAQALSTYGFIRGRLFPPGDTTSLKESFLRSVPGTTGTFGQLTEAMLGHVNSAQVELNRLLGREGAAAPLGVQQLIALL
jgi:hypothetical protein